MPPLYLFLWKQELRKIIGAYTSINNNQTSRDQIFPEFFKYLIIDSGWNYEYDHTVNELASKDSVIKVDNVFRFSNGIKRNNNIYSEEDQSVLKILNDLGDYVSESNLKTEYRKKFEERVAKGFYKKVAEDLLTELMDDGEIFEWKELEDAASKYPAMTLPDYIEMKRNERKGQ